MQSNSARNEDLELLEVDPSYVRIGEVVSGKYRVEQVLGVGGMAFVLAVEHVTLHERFALKFLNEQLLADAQVKERFTQEAMAACRLRSEHIARVYDVGVHRGAPFLVMEHLTGRDLATVIHENGPLSIQSAVEWTMQACDALATAHRHGIVHRDIKPENLFLVEHEGLPSIKLLDFGISKIALGGSAPVSPVTDDLSLGTPCYMAPEHIRSTAAADAQSDLWSLGAVLYELLTGIEAFRGPTVTEVCAAVLEQQPPSLTELRPEVPIELADIVARCLEKDPALRFENVAELAAALLPFAPARAIVSVERTSSLMRVPTTEVADPRVSAIRTSSRPRGLAKTPHSGRARPTRATPTAVATAACALALLTGGGIALRSFLAPAPHLRADATHVATPREPSPFGAALALAPVAVRESNVEARPEPKAAPRPIPRVVKVATSARVAPAALVPPPALVAEAPKPAPTVELGY